MPCIAEIVLVHDEGCREGLRPAASTARVTLSLRDGFANKLSDRVLSVLELGVSGRSGPPEANVFLPTPSGSSTQKVDPTPNFDRRPNRPPLSLTICRTSAKPRPVPLPPITH